jgi:NAD-dependent dihydropyrimidine dehydrogenase PreA subunit
MHCDKAPCIAAAPNAVYKRNDGIVVIDPEKAKGNEALVASCPYGAIYWNTKAMVPQKCTGCAHLLDEDKLPHCVELCSTGGIRFGEEEDYLAEISQAETILSEQGTKPRVYYLNLPHLFIAGEVWDPADNEIVEGAVLTLTAAGSSAAVVLSDDFGDFWFNGIDAGAYKLTIKAKGFKDIEMDIGLKDSVNLGEIALVKK